MTLVWAGDNVADGPICTVHGDSGIQAPPDQRWTCAHCEADADALRDEARLLAAAALSEKLDLWLKAIVRDEDTRPHRHAFAGTLAVFIREARR